MDPNIRSILDDLYRIEPSLQAREDELVPVIKRLMAAKPDTHFDAAFAARLRKQLTQNTSQRDVSTVNNNMPSSSPLFFQRLAYATIGGLLTLVVAVPLTYQFTQTGSSLKNLGLNSPSAPTFRDLDGEAFGMLQMQAGGLGGDAAALSARTGNNAVGMGGGGSSATTAEADKMMILPTEPYPGPIYYHTYTYNGEPLDLSTISDTVYRRSGGINLAGRGGDLAGLQVGPVNLGAFSGLELQSFNVKQADKNGYNIYVDPMNGSISISGNEGHWSYSEGYTPLTQADMLPDDQVLAIANSFIDKFDINMSGFGEGVVDNRGVVYTLMQPADQRYFPDIVNVTYPMMVEGQEVYGSDGAPSGMTVTINVRTKSVVNAGLNLGSSFDRSAYELERDADKILSYAAQGGIYGYYMPQDDAEKIEIELGTPEVILMTHYNYSNSGVEYLYVPALSFPIVKNSDKYPVYQTAITVPLVKDIINQAQQQNPDVRIMQTEPAIEDAPAIKEDEVTTQIVE